MPITLIDYDTDFYQWAQQQAALLRNGQLTTLDVVNLAEEIEGMGKSNHRALASHLFVILMHLLKWQYQPDHRSISWRSSIRNGRRAIRRLIKESPSLKPQISALVQEEYADAREDAADETGLPLSTFPAVCPFSIAEILEDYWPISSAEC